MSSQVEQEIRVVNEMAEIDLMVDALPDEESAYSRGFLEHLLKKPQKDLNLHKVLGVLVQWTMNSAPTKASVKNEQPSGLSDLYCQLFSLPMYRSSPSA